HARGGVHRDIARCQHFIRITCQRLSRHWEDFRTMDTNDRRFLGTYTRRRKHRDKRFTTQAPVVERKFSCLTTQPHPPSCGTVCTCVHVVSHWGVSIPQQVHTICALDVVVTAWGLQLRRFSQLGFCMLGLVVPRNVQGESCLGGAN
ncbi:hypothetical protein LINPERHAP1_LOCUS19621, partial [Linum perenne]